MAPSPHWAEIGMVILTVVLAAVSLAALFYSYYFYRIQMDPYVIVYATDDFSLSQVGFPVVMEKFWRLRNGAARLPQRS
jgi:hypothetical protein